MVDFDADMDRPIVEVADTVSPWTLFIEMSNPETPKIGIQNFDKDKDVILFFKFYDPVEEKIHYMGHMSVSITSKFSDMIPELVRRAHLPPSTQVPPSPQGPLGTRIKIRSAVRVINKSLGN